MSAARFVLGLICVGALGVGSACPQPQDEPSWSVVAERMPQAFLSTWGTASDDVWVVGAADEQGPTVLHYDGQSWERRLTGEPAGTLWWVFGFDEGPVYFGGDGGMILRWQDGVFERMSTPGIGTVFGIWGSGPDEMWAVGGASASEGGFAWRLEGDAWVEEPSVPSSVVDGAAIWKVHGQGADDAWLVGSNGVTLHWDGNALAPVDTGVGSSLFTVHSSAAGHVAVGGSATGIIVEGEGLDWQVATVDPPAPGLVGVVSDDEGRAVAVGTFGSIYERNDGRWAPAELDPPTPHALHGVWMDELGGVWAVGGQVYLPPFTDGIIVHYGRQVGSDGL